MSISACENVSFDTLNSKPPTPELLSAAHIAAAHVARSARNSLRQLLAGVLTESTTSSTHDVTLLRCRSELVDTLGALRHDVEEKLYQLKGFESSATLSGFRSEPYRTQGPKQRQFAPSTDESIARHLVPRSVLHVGDAAHVRAVALAPICQDSSGRTCSRVIALLLSSGVLAIWERDIFSWHRKSSTESVAAGSSSSAMVFSLDGRLLWICASKEREHSLGSTSTLTLFDSTSPSSRQLKLLVSIDLPAGFASGPVPLFQHFGPLSIEGVVDGIAVATSSDSDKLRYFEPRVMTWACQVGSESLHPNSGLKLLLGGSFVASAVHLVGQVKIIKLAALPDKEDKMRLVLWLEPCPSGSVIDAKDCGELQIRSSDSGELLAWIPFGIGFEALRIVVPPQDSCPDVLRCCFGACSLLVLIERKGESEVGVRWDFAMAYCDPAKVADGACIGKRMDVTTLRSQEVQERCVEVLSCNENLLACRTESGGSYLFDWQQNRLHEIPDGWHSVAVSRNIIVLLRLDEHNKTKLAFLEAQ